MLERLPDFIIVIDIVLCTLKTFSDILQGICGELKR